jgi:PAS domain S-box-containing protein
MNNASSEIEFFRRRVAELERQVVAGPHMPPGDADTLLLSQLGTFEWDLRTGEIALDEHSRAMFDLRSPARIGIGDLLERVHSEDRARLHSEVQEALDRASRIETQFRIVLPSGEVRRIGTVGRAVGAERFVGVFADRHQAPVERDMRLATFDAVLARLQEFVYLFDPDGRLRYVNQPLLDLWGITAEEAIGKDFHDLGYPPELVELHRGQIQRVIETRQPVEGSNAYTSRQGVTGYYEYTFVPLFGPDGAVEAVGGRTRDITLERNAREALESSEEKYRSLFDSIDQGSCIIQLIFDPQGRPVDYLFLETNPVFEKQTGLRHAVGRTARELVPGLEPFWFETYGSVALTGKPVRFVRHAEAMERWFDVYAFRIGKPEDRRVALLFSDITDRKRAESEKESLLAQIQAERQRLERILSQAPVAIVVVRGPEYIVDLANPSYRALLQGRDIIGRRFADVVPEPVTEVWQAFERVRSTGEPFVVNDSYVRYDGDGDVLWRTTGSTSPTTRFATTTELCRESSRCAAR